MTRQLLGLPEASTDITPLSQDHSARSCQTPGGGTVLFLACIFIPSPPSSLHIPIRPAPVWGFGRLRFALQRAIRLFGAVLLGGVLRLHLISPQAPGAPLRTEVDILSFQNHHQAFRLSSVPHLPCCWENPPFWTEIRS